MATKRQKKNGGWEYIVKRAKILDKPIYLTFDDEVEGDAYVAKLEAMLDKGVVPDEFNARGTNYTFLAELIKDYMVHVAMPDSDARLLNVLYGRLGKTRMTQINYRWVEGWINGMKVELNLKPGTIRHYVGALGRCFDWASRRNVVSLIVNPIRQLPKNYAQYSTRDEKLAMAFDDDHEKQEDEERERRLEPGEEENIRKILDRQKPEGRQRALKLNHQAALELLFDLALESAMRMREMYTLTLDQIDIAQSTVFLDKTKNGNKRQVPLSSVAKARIAAYMTLIETGDRGMEGFNLKSGRLFPWWDGSLDKNDLAVITRKLSVQYSRIFQSAGCKDLNFHDLRHEATSRFFERTSMSDFEIMKITGHSSTRMLRRYSNLRASNLAAKLW